MKMPAIAFIPDFILTGFKAQKHRQTTQTDRLSYCAFGPPVANLPRLFAGRAAQQG
jgi:hypothetical protein